jgi:hypothetical protein
MAIRNELGQFVKGFSGNLKTQFKKGDKRELNDWIALCCHNRLDFPDGKRIKSQLIIMKKEDTK